MTYFVVLTTNLASPHTHLLVTYLGKELHLQF